jgi:two-component system, NarL family, sensor histidine kinase UhpB
MIDCLTFAAATGSRAWRFAVALALWSLLSIAPSARAADDQVVVIDRALSVQGAGDPSSLTQLAIPVLLPDDWATTRPRYQGSVWYRTRFDRPAGVDAHELQAMYIEHVCSNLEVYLNGNRIFSGGRMSEPLTRNCSYPQWIALPAALLQERGNLVDIRVQGHALQRVASRQRAGGMSAIKVGAQAVLAAEFDQRLFWTLTSVKIANLILAVMGCVMIGLSLMNRREAYLGYFGWLSLAWALLSARAWWRDMPWDTGVMEFLFCTGFAPLVALAVQFLLSYADLRSRLIENALAVQWVLLPATLLLAGPGRLFLMASLWYALLALEVLAAGGLYLVTSWRSKRQDFWPMAALLGVVALIVALEVVARYELVVLPMVPLLQFVVPVLFIGMATRLLQVFARALGAAEDGRMNLEERVKQATAEIERNFAQLAELRVEQVTEKERKRIAADLHDDLGAKLLTIVHTSESERISTLAREALEEMRLSVRGLTGKPMRLADALADWRAETVLRLGQANIEADWRSPTEEIEQLLPARGFVQTTRILREAVSNIIKHSGASHCKVRCAISERQFGLTVQDNGKGIPMELDGKLDRGHGMSSMKHRAKQMQGQCLVESGPGYGTVIRLTLPL